MKKSKTAVEPEHLHGPEDSHNKDQQIDRPRTEKDKNAISSCVDDNFNGRLHQQNGPTAKNTRKRGKGEGEELEFPLRQLLGGDFAGLDLVVEDIVDGEKSGNGCEEKAEKHYESRLEEELLEILRSVVPRIVGCKYGGKNKADHDDRDGEQIFTSNNFVEEKVGEYNVGYEDHAHKGSQQGRRRKEERHGQKEARKDVAHHPHHPQGILKQSHPLDLFLTTFFCQFLVSVQRILLQVHPPRHHDGAS
mmetsp:Transcript_36326/g.102352  ORF Transcript_36326/g.102352 Transcript_36326/m.102352 type:complete len:248 (-) Transcript_36326:209-952(-)